MMTAVDDGPILVAVEMLATHAPYERDRLGGGIAPITLSRHLPLSPSRLSDRLQDLADRGYLVEVRGASLETGPRASFLPADHPDASGGTAESTRSRASDD